MWQRIAFLLVFALIGPLIGGLVACPIAVGCFALGADKRESLEALTALPLCLVYGPIFGYIIGFMPALVVGVTLAALKPEPSRRYLGKVSRLSAVVSFGVVGVFSVGRRGWYDPSGSGLLIMAIAAVAGLVAGNLCWRLLTYRRWRPQQEGT